MGGRFVSHFGNKNYKTFSGMPAVRKGAEWKNMSSSGVLLVTVTVIGNIEGNNRYQGEHTSLFQTSELESALG